MKSYKIAILGNHDTVLGFKGLGIDARSLNEKNFEERTVEVLENSDYAIVFIIEDWADRLAQVLNKYRSQPLPAIVTLPPPSGTTGAALKNLKKIVEQAIGSDILFNQDQ